MAEQGFNRASPRLFGLVVVMGLLTAIAIGGCAGASDGSDADPLSIPVHQAGPVPELTIGVLSGDTALEFQSIQDVDRLSDGRIVLSDSGDRRLHLFSPEGEPLGTMGTAGPGPREFRSLRSVYVLPGDTLMALDPTARQVLRFTGDGEWVNSSSDISVWQDSLFTMDVWPTQRFVVRGAESAAARTRVRQTLASVPLPSGSSLSRMALVGDQGEVWIREEWSGLSSDSRWLVVSANGEANRWVDLPAGFEPQTVIQDRIYGRSVGEFDVERAQVYRVTDSGLRSDPPLWFTQPTVIPDSAAIDREELMDDVRTSVRGFAMGQEIYYGGHMSYSPTVDSLDLTRAEIADSLSVEILYANSRGWAMIAAHPHAPFVCTLAYGSGAPAGWMGGRTACGNQP